MSALDRLTLAPGISLPAFAGRVAGQVVNALRAWRNRREIYRLGEMSDWELADIGLTRTDLYVAVRAPVGVDPTAHLGFIAAARARDAEAAARRVC